MDILFSILVVALNPGEKLQKTVKSILDQEYENIEIIVKDGMSKDGSVEALAEKYAGEKRLKIVRTPDKSIYDAMNQAVALARGDYVLFLNCGDTLYDGQVLQKVKTAIKKTDAGPHIFYGDTFYEQTGVKVHSAPRITGFTCYRNIPCHQSCFYAKELFVEKQYDLQYRIRADYDHFLWCFYRKHTSMIYLDMVVSVYEGGGYSEDRANLELDKKEHRKIVEEYMSKGELMRYRLIMALTLAPLRSWMAENQTFSGLYHKMKDCLYGRKKA